MATHCIVQNLRGKSLAARLRFFAAALGVAVARRLKTPLGSHSLQPISGSNLESRRSRACAVQLLPIVSLVIRSLPTRGRLPAGAVARGRGMPVQGRGFALDPISHCVTGIAIADDRRAYVRELAAGKDWVMSYRDYSVRPPRLLQDGCMNPLGSLGECGDKKCALYRLREGAEMVRPEFLEFCMEQIKEYVKDHPGLSLTYCSLGCGGLYFDWELLDRLVNVDGVPITQVWLVDLCFDRQSKYYADVLQSRTAFANWFAGSGFSIHAFSNSTHLSKWVHDFPEVGQAHVVMQCDAVDTEAILENETLFGETVISDQAINLQLFAQLVEKKSPGDRKDLDVVAPSRTLRYWEAAGSNSKFREVERHRWQDGRWLSECDIFYEEMYQEMLAEYR